VKAAVGVARARRKKSEAQDIANDERIVARQRRHEDHRQNQCAEGAK
jgi:hypothetical protein